MRLVAALLLAAAPALAAPAPAARRLLPAPATEALAKQLADAVNVAADDVVLVRVGPDATALAELLAGEIARRGASSTLEYVSPAAVRSAWNEAPEGYLDRPGPMQLQLLQSANVVIELASRDDPGLEVGIDPVRLARVRRARQAVNDAFYRTEVRRLVVAGAGFPTDETARLFKADPAALSKSFWEAVQVKTPLIEDRTGRVRKVLAGLKEVRVTAPNGTNLTLRLAGLPLYANTGRIDEEVMARPGPKEVTLPAGEVSAAPHQFFGTGTLVVDSLVINGVVVKDLKLHFEDGKAVPEAGGENFEVFKKAFALASGAKDVIGLFAVGTNETSKPLPGSSYRSSEMSGVVTIGIGFNKGVGGSNEDTGFQAKFRLVNATVKVNDQVLVDAGVLKLL